MIGNGTVFSGACIESSSLKQVTNSTIGVHALENCVEELVIDVAL